MVDRAIANARFFHFANDGFEGLDILGRITVKLNVSNMASITESVIWSFDLDLIKGGDRVVNWDVEGVSVEVTIGDARDFAIFFFVNFGEATSDTLSWCM